MSAINKDKKILFVHIPKTAGSSMEDRDFFKPLNTRHYSITDYVEQGVDIDEFFKFAFVRNPYDRLASAVLSHILDREESPLIHFNEAIIRHEKMLDKWVATKPQHTFICLDGKVAMDFVGRFENLQNDWEEVCEKIGVKLPLPHKKRGEFHPHIYKGLYTPKTIKIVKEIYEKDFKLCGYSKEI